MCGIAGLIDFGEVPVDDARGRVSRMTSALTHRGPDSAGFFSDRNAFLGHRRLAIIDLATGDQPMAALDGRVQVVFNGEIYNYRELRAELHSAGHAFRTRSDTEVLLNGYLEWGDRLPERLNGMFAFLIWDARTRSALAARDRAGEKPFYWLRDGRRFAFASELGALRAGGLIERRDVDPQSLDCYLTLGYVPAPRTIHRDVFKLLPAHRLKIDAAGQHASRYWKLPEDVRHGLTPDEALEEFEPLFDDAVRRQLVSEVPLGAFLSGGLDSALVVSSMARQSGRVITNTIGSSNPALDERSPARQVAARFATEHHEFEVQPQRVEGLERIIGCLDEPLGDPSVIPTWHVCRMARQTVTVALSGDGGDECFAGYTSRYVPHATEAGIRAAIPVSLRSPMFGSLARIWPRSRRLPRPLRLATIFRNLASSDAGAFYEDLAWLKSDARRTLYTPDFTGELRGFTPRETVQPYYEAGDGDPLSRSQRTDQQVYMPDDVLMKVDRMSMAHSLETRAPLLDHRIREFAARLPATLKLENGVGKLLLRRLARKRLPPEITVAPKRGFSIDLAGWMRGDLRDYVRGRLSALPSLLADRLEPASVQRLWREHQSGSRDHSAVLWNLVVVSLWAERR